MQKLLKGHRLILHAQRAAGHSELEPNASGPTEGCMEGSSHGSPHLGGKTTMLGSELHEGRQETGG